MGFNRGFDFVFSFFKSAVLFNTVLLVKRFHLSLKTQIQLLTNASLFLGQCIPFHGLQFGFHVRAQFPLKGIECQFVLCGKVGGDGRLHGVDALGDGLLTQPTFSSKIGSQPFFLAEPRLRSHGLIERGGTGAGELRSKRSQRDPFV